jgi:hypothetical protein
MTIDLHHHSRLVLQRRLKSLSRSALRARLDALRLRLGRYGLPGAGHRRTAGRFTAIERVMRRAALHQSRAFTAHVNLQALLSAGITRHTQRLELRSLRGPGFAMPARPRHERLTLLQRVLHQRLLQRIIRPAAPATTPTPRAPVVTRAQQRSAWPRPQLTMVRTQPPLPPQAAFTEPASNIAAFRDPRRAPAHPHAAAMTAPLVLPPQELSRLTDHVIRQLDHRVLSWQERTGRN